MKSAEFEPFASVLEEAARRMDLAYEQLDASYWEGKSAFSHRFDNFRLMVDRQVEAPPVEARELQEAYRQEIERADRVALYFGVPWCVQTCSFCDLAYSRNPAASEKQAYVDLVLREMAEANQLGLARKPVASVYFGGGTPSILDTELLCKFIDGAIAPFTLVDKAVITLEASPATLNARKLAAMQGRVTRISLGVQSTDTELRQREGRILAREKLLERVVLTLDHFSLVNADVLYGMPGQSFESIYLTLVDLVSAGVPSITYYRNELFPGTKSYTQAQTAPWDTVGEIAARKMYFFGKTLLEDAGYVENPLGWFVKQDKTPTAVPWTQMVAGWSRVVPYFGFGVGAFSTSRSYWIQNVQSTTAWAEALESGRPTAYRHHRLSPRETFMVRFMRHIRVFGAFDRRFLMEESGVDATVLSALVERLLAQGLLRASEQLLELTEAGASLIHWVIDDFAQVVTGVRQKEAPKVWALSATS
jgi:oxygen-independent coproporphyrinogen-3 oxidase